MQLGEPSRRRHPLRALGLVVLSGIVVVLALAYFRAGAAPSIDIAPKLPGIGKRTPVVVTVATSGRGLGPVRVDLVQGDRVVPLAEKPFTPRPFWAFWGARTERAEIPVEVGRETIDGLKGGEATIRVSAQRASTWLRHPAPAVKELTLPVRLTPPSLQVLSLHTIVAQGGSEAVVYRVDAASARDGVQAGERFFAGFPLPGGGAGDRFAFFAVPYDTADAAGVHLVADDGLGNLATVSFVERFIPRPPKTDTIALDDALLAKVVPEIMSHTPDLADRGSPLENYLQINGELRRRNGAALAALAADSPREFLWREPFLPLPNAAVMSSFADRRTYTYQDKVVDHQDHLGFDLAAVSRAPVPAANRGRVVLAEYFGIYGNCVVLDHGYGLMTLYAHLSSIDVAKGQTVERGQILGKSGSTGLAGGDHLHFTTLLGGLPVNPIEWWDAHWIHDRLKGKLGAALPIS
jgi:murein DD-endopeptidase MepM/ murein hydrolase activator NlpD